MQEMSTLNKLTLLSSWEFEHAGGIVFVDKSCKNGRGYQLRQTSFTYT